MSDSFVLDKETIKQYELKRMDAHLKAGRWSPHEKVALVCRILFDAGHDSGLAGQITARLDDDRYITQQLGLGFDEISSANLLTVDRDLNVISGDGMPNPANRFHSWVYRARPDVQCIVHTHPAHVSALAMLEEMLVVSHMDSCILYDEVAFLPRWPGIPVGNAEGEIITEALGSKKALLLGHHGLIAAGSSVEEACVIALQFERAARLQLLAMAAGDIKPVDPALAREAHDWLLQPKRIDATFSYYVKKILARSNPLS